MKIGTTEAYLELKNYTEIQKVSVVSFNYLISKYYKDRLSFFTQ